MLTISGVGDMTKNRLKKLRGLIKEAEHLQSELNDTLLFPSCNEYVADSAQDYSTGRPHTFKVEGYGQESYVKLRQKLYDKLNRIQQDRQEIEDWLDGVADPEIRDILRLQYINGLTQEQIADELGYERSGIASKIKRFWDSQSATQTTK